MCVCVFLCVVVGHKQPVEWQERTKRRRYYLHNHPPIHTHASIHTQVYFDIEIGGEKAGRIVMELAADVAPKTAGRCVCVCRFHHITITSRTLSPFPS